MRDMRRRGLIEFGGATRRQLFSASGRAAHRSRYRDGRHRYPHRDWGQRTHRRRRDATAGGPLRGDRRLRSKGAHTSAARVRVRAGRDYVGRQRARGAAHHSGASWLPGGIGRPSRRVLRLLRPAESQVRRHHGARYGASAADSANSASRWSSSCSRARCSCTGRPRLVRSSTKIGRSSLPGRIRSRRSGLNS